ncbi:M43 family zinc metalloprotease [Bacteroidota bacterium]
MRKNVSIIVILLALFANSAIGQTQRCGTSEKMKMSLERNPELRKKRQALQAFTEQWSQQAYKTTAASTVITIPVVVHVVYKKAAENISKAQILSQIDVLNEDFRAMNSDISGVPSVWTSLIADCQIEFVLANKTPGGQYTSGITRTETTVADWGGSDNVKYTSLGGHDAWPNDKYLNIWVCNIGANYLGFAYQPNGTIPAEDGVVIGYKVFGTTGTISSTYKLGRTSTHEIGHYFNLDHLWGPEDDNLSCIESDNVDDTPVQAEANFDCETFPHVSCSNGPNGDMFNNFMDYSDDHCMFFFTEGQKTRMLAALNGERASLKTSNGYVVGIEETFAAKSLTVFPSPANNLVNISLNHANAAQVDLAVFDMVGKQVLFNPNINLKNTTHQMDVSALPTGFYMLKVSAKNISATRKFSIVK